MSDLTGYSYSRGEVVGQKWTDTGMVIAVEIIKRQRDPQVGSVSSHVSDVSDSVLSMTIRLDTGAHIAIVQTLDLGRPIQAGDRVGLVTEGGVTRVVTTTTLMK